MPALQIGSACAGTWGIIWMNRFPIIRHSAKFDCAMASRCFEAIVEQCQQASWCGAKNCTSTPHTSTRTPIWTPLPLVLRSRHEKLSRSISMPFLRQNPEEHAKCSSGPFIRTLIERGHFYGGNGSSSTSFCPAHALSLYVYGFSRKSALAGSGFMPSFQACSPIFVRTYSTVFVMASLA